MIFEVSTWWIVLIAVFCAGLGTLMYRQKSSPWPKWLNGVLGTFRFITLFVIFLLLLNPLINYLYSEIESPTVVIAVDNSTSMLTGTDSTSLNQLVEHLERSIEAARYNSRLHSIDRLIDEGETLVYDNLVTNLSKPIRAVERLFENQNLGAILLISDGIYNRGSSPVYHKSLKPIYTVGVGDTLPKSDVKILQVNTNDVVYQGNKFPVEIFLGSEGYSDQQTKISLLRNGSRIETKDIDISNNSIVNFEVDTDNAGLYRYTVLVDSIQDEITAANNKYDFYVQVIEGKERILITSNAPHPDIGAIKRSLSSSENYELITYIPGINEFQDLEYDVVIEINAFSPANKLDIKGNPGRWYIFGPTSLRGDYTTDTGVSINVQGNQTDNVRPSRNSAFSKFKLSEANDQVFSSLPTINVPFGEYTLAGTVEVLLFQQVGSVTTNLPLMSFYSNGLSKSVAIFGSGIWKWALQESAINDNREVFDELVVKTIQFLSVRNDKRKFIFQPGSKAYSAGEQIGFETESYNDIYERIGGHDISLTIAKGDGTTTQYDFVASATSDNLTIGNLEEGIYSYQAETQFSGESHQINGEFLVEELQLENLELTANHGVLKQLSQSTGGKYYHVNQVDQLNEELASLDLKGLIHTDREYTPLVDLKWILMLLLGLIITEWGIRKHHGGY